MAAEPRHSSSSAPSAHSQPHDQSFAHLHDKRTFGMHLPGLDIGIGGGSRRASHSRRCNGWLWFGSSIGWAPPASWSCSSSWQIPAQWSSVWRVNWW
ncbi:hypothetical protein JCM10296v2_001312 [Rhodotorula toruloides]